VTHADLIIRVSSKLGVDPELVLSRDRRAPLAWARHLSIWLVRNGWGYSYPHIGGLFGGLDHTSVMHACRRVDRVAGMNLALAEWLVSELKTCAPEHSLVDLWRVAS
jgi:chromosomal replication initiator protein